MPGSRSRGSQSEAVHIEKISSIRDLESFAEYLDEHKTDKEKRRRLLNVLGDVYDSDILAAVCSNQKIVQTLRTWLVDSENEDETLDVLRILNRLSFTFQDLHTSRLGRVVKKLNEGSATGPVFDETKTLLDKWTELISNESRKKVSKKEPEKPKKKVSFVSDDQLCSVRYFEIERDDGEEVHDDGFIAWKIPPHLGIQLSQICQSVEKGVQEEREKQVGSRITPDPNSSDIYPTESPECLDEHKFVDIPLPVNIPLDLPNKQMHTVTSEILDFLDTVDLSQLKQGRR